MAQYRAGRSGDDVRSDLLVIFEPAGDDGGELVVDVIPVVANA